MIDMTNKQRGNCGLGIAIGYFSTNGYIVSIPLNDTQDYDYIDPHYGKIVADGGEVLKEGEEKKNQLHNYILHFSPLVYIAAAIIE